MKDSFFKKNTESLPRIIKIGRYYLFLDSKSLRKKVNAKVKEINENSILPAALLSEYDDEKCSLLFPESIFIDNYMSFDFDTEDFIVSFSGYPTDQDQLRLTKAALFSDIYNIYGIYIGMRVDIADSLLRSNGFSKSSDNDTECYCFPGIRIFLSASNGVINEITIEIETYYVGNYIY